MTASIISDSHEFRRDFLKSMRTYSRYYWATAWATDNPGYVTLNGYRFYLMDELTKGAKNGKIGKLICGLYGAGGQKTTSPKFVSMMREAPNVLFVLKDGDDQYGVAMHSKIYLFVNSDSDWCCYVGSANFTHGGFTENFEVMTKVTSSNRSADEKSFISRAKMFFDGFFLNKGIRQANEKEIVDYLFNE